MVNSDVYVVTVVHTCVVKEKMRLRSMLLMLMLSVPVLLQTTQALRCYECERCPEPLLSVPECEGEELCVIRFYTHPGAFTIFTARRYAKPGICYGNSVCPSVRPSVRLSVRPSVTRVDQSKTVEAKIMQFSSHSSHIPLVFDR